MGPIVPSAPARHCFHDGVELNLDGVLDHAPVAAGHGHRDRDAAFARRGEHTPVPLGEAGGRQLQAAEPVAFVRIGAREVEDQAGRRVLVTAPQFGERGVERLEVFGIAAAIGQLDVEIARLFAEREVLRAVHRQREDGGVVGKDRGRAVALVHVEIDHGHPQQRRMARPMPLGLHEARRDRDVVEHAVARALVGARVMRSAGQVGGNAIGKRCARRGDRRADRAARPRHHRLAPGEAYLTLLRFAQRAVTDGAHVLGRVRQREFAVARGRRLPHLEPGEPLEALAQQPVLRHRKAMPGRQRQHELIGVEGLHVGAAHCDADANR